VRRNCRRDHCHGSHADDASIVAGLGELNAKRRRGLLVVTHFQLRATAVRHNSA
jgi:hypothetical protein